MTKQFDQNDRRAILAALAHPTPTGKTSLGIVEAIATRVNALANVLNRESAEHGVHDAIEIAKPQTELNEIAVALFRQELQELGAPPVVVHEYGKQ